MPHTNEMAVAKGLQRGVKMSDSSNFKTYEKHMQRKHLKTKNTETSYGRAKHLPT